MTNLNSICIIIPVYNEQDEIVNSINQILSHLDTLNLEYSIIVVNDGSTDGTAEKLSSFTDNMHIEFIHHTTNKGYGASIKSAILQTEKEYICIIDADGTYDIKELNLLLEKYKETDYDMVVGSRNGSHVKIPVIRKPAKWILGKLANYITSSYIPDINSGFRIIKKKIIMDFFNLLPNGFSLTTTSTLSMIINGFDVCFVPINYYKRTGHSKIKPIRDTLGFFKLILKIGLFFSPFKIFMPISFVFIITSIIISFITKIYYGQIADIITLIFFATGLQVFVIALLAEMINQRTK